MNASHTVTLQNASLQIRPMHLSDLNAVMQIETEVHAYPWSRGNFSDSLTSGYHCLLLEQKGNIIGYAVLMIVLDEAHLLNISIVASRQGLGFGRALLTHLVGLGQNLQALNMFLEVRLSNLAAIGLYESLGFNEMAIRKAYYPTKGGREDAVLMGLAL